jgi:hypothetical protein
VTVRHETKVEFVVYRAAPVEGWPSDIRRIVRTGFCSEIDVDGQVTDPHESVMVVEEHVDLKMHAVRIEPRPHIVPSPEA